MSLDIQDTIECNQGEFGMDWGFTAKDSTGTVFNLTGYTIAFKAWREGITGTLLINGTGAIVVAASGTCKYSVVSGDTATAGYFYAALVLTKTGVALKPILYALEIHESG